MAKASSNKFSPQVLIITAVVSALVAGSAVYAWHKHHKSGSSGGERTETLQILQAARDFCEKAKGASCDGAIDKRKGNSASVKSGGMFVLVSKNSSGQWIGVLISNESDICKTG